MTSLSLLNDILFKIVFGTEQHLPVLRALLNALLELTGESRITELEILNPILDKQHQLDKGLVLDVMARDGRRRLYNIEVQLARKPAYVERALYYLARLFGSQLDAGQPYTRVTKTIGISLLDFALFPEQEDLHSRCRLYDEAHHREVTDVLELHLIELSKFRHDKPHELQTSFEKWLHVLKFSELYNDRLAPIPEILACEEGISMALDATRTARASDEVRMMIEMREKAAHDWATDLESALLEGQQKGHREGRREGLLETARRLRETGMSTEMIAQVTGLSPHDLDR